MTTRSLLAKLNNQSVRFHTENCFLVDFSHVCGSIGLKTDAQLLGKRQVAWPCSDLQFQAFQQSRQELDDKKKMNITANLAFKSFFQPFN